MRTCFIALWMGASAFSCPWLAHALELPGDREQVRERQQQLLDEQRQRLDELQQLPGRELQLESSAPAAEEACFEIRSIRLEGAELIDETARRRLLSPFENQCLGQSRLNELLKVITQFYLDRGYVTSRAYLPPQDLADGELQVKSAGRLSGQRSLKWSVHSSRSFSRAWLCSCSRMNDARPGAALFFRSSLVPSSGAVCGLGGEMGHGQVQLAARGNDSFYRRRVQA